MMFSLKNKVALVSGGAKGIGKGIIKVLSQAGAKTIIADIDDETGLASAKELGADFMHLDVTKKEQCQNVIKQVVEKYGKLDILCSNTGIFPQASLKDMTESDWDTINNVNLKGMFFLIQPALAVMEKQQSGRIIITSSITGPVTGYPGWSHYGATKAGQLGFMRSAALEYARYGININAVMPGNILTEGLKAQGEGYIKEMTASIPTHSLGSPEDIGYTVCFLASNEAKFITGQTIIVDGGQILPESPDAIL